MRLRTAQLAFIQPIATVDPITVVPRSLPLALLLSAPLHAQGEASPVHLQLDRFVYEPGDHVTLVVSGQPGHVPVLGIDVDAGPRIVAGVGEVSLGFSPNLRLFVLPPLDDHGRARLRGEVACGSPFVERPGRLQVVCVDPADGRIAGLSNPASLRVSGGSCGATARRAEADPAWTKRAPAAAFDLGALGSDFDFVGGASFVEGADSVARLSGVLVSHSALGRSFALEIACSGRIDVADGRLPPQGSPVRELQADAYAVAGGPVDPREWRYYGSLSGTLTGLGELEGVRVALRLGRTAVQVGRGASGMNLAHGLSGTLFWRADGAAVEPLGVPVEGPGRFALDLGGDGQAWARTPVADERVAQRVVASALELPGVGDDFVIVGQGSWVERSDGGASLLAVVRRASDRDARFALHLELGARTDPGRASHPPPGNPVRELQRQAYADGGGVVDPEAWRYYRDVSGTLTGLNGFEGAEVRLERGDAAVQVGLGANGIDLRPGLGGSLFGWTVRQPTAGDRLPASMPGARLRVELGDGRR